MFGCVPPRPSLSPTWQGCQRFLVTLKPDLVKTIIFYGFTDTEFEPWAISAKKIVDACADNLAITLASPEVERAHRLGRFLLAKRGPSLRNSPILRPRRATGGFKDSNFFVAQDYSARIRLARNKLVECGRSLNITFKLRFDKLLVGDRCFVFDVTTNSVVEIQTKQGWSLPNRHIRAASFLFTNIGSLLAKRDEFS